ncbi:hypothetical protein Taro_044004 [Colocasia esculenta]|uniref:Uncharacterized protein n=1 Tax=Colocasia esculenta TaxID=4460 RepID=A0A843X4V1_COLES|nr:hypothetical protein [Colocasia esculenta]
MSLHHDLHAAGYFFNPRIQYKDNVHNDGEVMRGTMNVITRLARTMNERLDATTEVERYRMKLGIYEGYDVNKGILTTLPEQDPESKEPCLNRTRRIGSDRIANRISPDPHRFARIGPIRSGTPNHGRDDVLEGVMFMVGTVQMAGTGIN